MKNLNFGKINRGMVEMLSNEKTHRDVLDYVNIIKESKTLQKAFKIYNNLECEKFVNETLAIKFIDENRKLIDFNEYEFLNENRKLDKFNNDIEISKETHKLYEAIDQLIKEDTSGTPNPKVITSCYSVILESLMSNEPTDESSDDESYFNELLDESIKIFNDKYSTLNESEKKMMNVLIYSNQEKKSELFEICKNEVVGMLNDYVKENPSMELKIQETLNKANSLVYSEDNMIEIYRLHESLSSE